MCFAWISRAQTPLDSAVSFTVKDINGNTHRLYDYLDQGKTVVIDFFTVTCGPCATYAPEINESYHHFGCNTGNIVFLGINWGADNGQVADFGQENGAEYPEISGMEGNGNHVVSDYGILSYPTVILIQPDRFIAEKYIWPPSAAHLDSLAIFYGGVQMDCNTAIYDRPAKSFSGNIQSVFPNPASGACTIVIKDQERSYDVRILSANGTTAIYSANLLFTGAKTSIDLSVLIPGYYLLQLISGKCIIDCKPLMVQ
jgi:thiol-disulfide isomerase/thioredoxin